MIKVESKLRPPEPEPPLRPEPVPRITQLLALAIKMEDMLARGEVRSQREMAEIAGVTPARVSQILRLLDLAPGVQEWLLFTLGRPISDRTAPAAVPVPYLNPHSSCRHLPS